MGSPLVLSLSQAQCTFRPRILGGFFRIHFSEPNNLLFLYCPCKTGPFFVTEAEQGLCAPEALMFENL